MLAPQRIGLIALGAHPYHLGHDRLVRLAASECDSVFLAVSTSDRARKGEVAVLGNDMETLWREVIAQTLPKNVHVSYGGSPIGKVWYDLVAFDNDTTSDTFFVYGDPHDLTQAFPEHKLRKYCGNLLAQARVILRAVERHSTAAVSGTMMRSWLAEGDKASFIDHLPPGIDRDKVWTVLRARVIDPPKRIKTTAKAHSTTDR